MSVLVIAWPPATFGVCTRNLKLRMIEHVEELSAKLDRLRLRDVEVLDGAEVNVDLVGATQRTIAGIAKLMGERLDREPGRGPANAAGL